MSLISLVVRISNMKSCELKRALDSIDLTITSSCTSNALTLNANGIKVMGIVDVVFTTILFLATLYFGWRHVKEVETPTPNTRQRGVWFILVPVGIKQNSNVFNC